MNRKVLFLTCAVAAIGLAACGDVATRPEVKALESGACDYWVVLQPADTTLMLPEGSTATIDFSARLAQYCSYFAGPYVLGLTFQWAFWGAGMWDAVVTGNETASVTFYGPTDGGTMNVVATTVDPDGNVQSDTANVHLYEWPSQELPQ